MKRGQAADAHKTPIHRRRPLDACSHISVKDVCPPSWAVCQFAAQRAAPTGQSVGRLEDACAKGRLDNARIPDRCIAVALPSELTPVG